MVGTDNEHRFMVATQDARLRSRLRSTVAAAPLIFLNKVVLLVEPPSALALATANKVGME